MATLPHGQSARLLLPGTDTPTRTYPAGFLSAFDAAIERSDLDPYTRLVLSRLAIRADETGTVPASAMPGVAGLAVMTGMSRQGIRIHLRIAEDRGWLAWESAR